MPNGGQFSAKHGRRKQPSWPAMARRLARGARHHAAKAARAAGPRRRWF